MEVLQYTYKSNDRDAYKVQVSTTEIAQSWNKFKVRARKLPPAEYCSYGMQTGGKLEVWNAETGAMEEVAERWKAEVARDVLPNGMHLFCHMSTDAKAKLLQEISDKLGNPYKIEYMES